MNNTKDITHSQIFFFWLPLFLTWVFMSSETAVLNSFVARLPEEKLNLAAFGVSFPLLILCEAPILSAVSGAIAICKDADSYKLFYKFTIITSLILTAVILILSIPPVCKFMVEEFLCIDPVLTPLIQKGLLITFPCPFAVAYRRFFQGIIIIGGNSKLIVIGTIIRLSVLFVSAFFFFHRGYSGIVVASTSLTIGILVEAVIARLMAASGIKKLQKATVENKLTSMRQVIKFYYPLATTTIINVSIGSLTSFFLAQGAYPLESLASFPMVMFLILIIRSSAFSFHEVIVAKWEKGLIHEKLSNFNLWLGVICLFITALFVFTPLNNFLFITVGGLSEELTHFASISAKLLVLFPVLTIANCWYKGIFTNQHRTFPITVGALYEIVTIAIVLAVGILTTKLPGAYIASIALTLGSLVSLIFLRFTWTRKIN